MTEKDKKDREEHPGWDLPPVIRPETDSDKQPPGMDLPPNEWKKWKKRHRPGGDWRKV